MTEDIAMALFSSLAVVESLSVAAAASSSSRGFQEPGSIHSAAARVWSGAGRMRGGAASSLVVRGSSSGTSSDSGVQDPRPGE